MNMADYWREYYRKNPAQLQTRSNEHAWQTWLADHPKAKDVPKEWRTALSNLKGELRERGTQQQNSPASNSEEIEAAIDEVIWLVKDRPEVARLLKEARRMLWRE